jgi:hypothetical protein
MGSLSKWDVVLVMILVAASLIIFIHIGFQIAIAAHPISSLNKPR